MIENDEKKCDINPPVGGGGADYLIIGQGICGTMLSWFLKKENKSFIIIDDDREHTASKVAAGIINPVTGRRYVSSWMTEELTSFALQSYKELGVYLNSEFIFQKDIIDIFPSAQMRDAFVNRIAENNIYLHTYPNQNDFNPFFNYDFGCGRIAPAYLVHIQLMLASWRKELFNLNAIRQTTFEVSKLKVSEEGVTYEDINAKKIIFCDGISSMQNEWFQLLPFSAVKGEALIIECNDMPHKVIFKKGFMMAPHSVENHFWLGSDYQWEFEDAAPSEAFYKKATAHLKHWLKVPFNILFHQTAIRPATIERRPFVGFHPLYSNVGILNGMGTKGTSLAPYFAHQLVQHLVYDFPIMEEASVQRFSRILSK